MAPSKEISLEVLEQAHQEQEKQQHYTSVDEKTATERENELHRLVRGKYTPDVIDDAKLFAHETDQHFYRRYLISGKWKVEAAMQQLEATIAWRKNENIAALSRINDASEILGCSEDRVLQQVPMTYRDRLPPRKILRDLKQRPIFVYRFGKFNISGLLKLTTAKQFLRYIVWRLERSMQVLGENTCSSTNTASTTLSDNYKCVILVDLQGFSLYRHLNRTTMRFASTLNKVAADYYPETLARMFIINTPGFFQVAWKALGPLIDPQTKTKISILASSCTATLLEDMSDTTLVAIVEG